jgi:hypothetical protein
MTESMRTWVQGVLSAAESYLDGATIDVNITTKENALGKEVYAETAAGADIYVELDKLCDLYNTLSDLASDLDAKIDELTAIVERAGSDPAAAGNVPGVQAAYAVMLHAAGADGSRDSVLANMIAIQNMIYRHMDAAWHNAKNYANTEHLLVQEFKKAGALLDGTQKPSATSGAEVPSARSSTAASVPGAW